MAALAVSSLTASVSTVPSHPLYATWSPIWRKLAHVYEGAGGFLDGTYLHAHPREWLDWQAENPSKPSKKLKTRRALARYENVGAPIIDQKSAALFRTPPNRQVGDGSDATKDHSFHEWQKNVDGLGTSYNDWLREAWKVAGIFGYTVVVMGRDAIPEGTPQTKANQRAPYLRMYCPLDMPDWLISDKGGLTAVRLYEAVPRTDFSGVPGEVLSRVKTITASSYKVEDVKAPAGRKKAQAAEPEPAAEIAHDFGVLPVAILYAKRRALTPVIGQSVLHDPNMHIDFYNLTSEIRELLRNQTFGILNIQLPADGVDLDKARTALGGSTGTEDIAFTYGPMTYVQPDTENVGIYQEERSQLLRTIYRLCAVPFEIDSRDAESEGALKLKREDMKEILSDYANELERFERQIADFWWRAEFGADAGPAKLAEEGLTIRYDRQFDVTPFQELLDQGTAMLSLKMPWKVVQAVQKRTLPYLLPDASQELVDQLTTEIDSQKDPAEVAREERQKALGKAFGGPQGASPELDKAA